MGAAAGRVTAVRALAVAGCLAASPCWALDPWAALSPPPAATSEAKTGPSLSLDLSPAVGAPTLRNGAKPLDLGLRWRQPVASEQHVDITAWRRTESSPDAYTLSRTREPVYGARVEMNLKPSKARFVATHRFIGLQLDSGDRILLRRTDGNATLYYRTRF